MLSIERVKELLGNPSLSDEELERIRDACDAWAGLVVDAMEYSGEDWEREDWSESQTQANARI